MNEQSRNAAWIAAHPWLWFGVMYAVSFTACTAANDLLRLLPSSGFSERGRYLLALAVTLPMWLGSWRWAVRRAVETRANS